MKIASFLPLATLISTLWSLSLLSTTAMSETRPAYIIDWESQVNEGFFVLVNQKTFLKELSDWIEEPGLDIDKIRDELVAKKIFLHQFQSDLQSLKLRGQFLQPDAPENGWLSHKLGEIDQMSSESIELSAQIQLKIIQVEKLLVKRQLRSNSQLEEKKNFESIHNRCLVSSSKMRSSFNSIQFRYASQELKIRSGQNRDVIDLQDIYKARNYYKQLENLKDRLLFSLSACSPALQDTRNNSILGHSLYEEFESTLNRISQQLVFLTSYIRASGFLTQDNWDHWLMAVYNPKPIKELLVSLQSSGQCQKLELCSQLESYIQNEESLSKMIRDEVILFPDQHKNSDLATGAYYINFDKSAIDPTVVIANHLFLNELISQNLSQIIDLGLISYPQLIAYISGLNNGSVIRTLISLSKNMPCSATHLPCQLFKGAILDIVSSAFLIIEPDIRLLVDRIQDQRYIRMLNAKNVPGDLLQKTFLISRNLLEPKSPEDAKTVFTLVNLQAQSQLKLPSDKIGNYLVSVNFLAKIDFIKNLNRKYAQNTGEKILEIEIQSKGILKKIKTDLESTSTQTIDEVFEILGENL